MRSVVVFATCLGLGCVDLNAPTACSNDPDQCIGAPDSTAGDTGSLADTSDTLSGSREDTGDATSDSAMDSATIDSTTIDSTSIDCTVDAHVDSGSTTCPSTASCGPGESCCTTLLVPGGTFSRSYDGVTGGYTNPKYKATISDFRLDKYEVTVGRFRAFTQAVVAGYKPADGSGKHTHVNCGAGLNGGTEPGWRSAWNSNLPSDATSWNTALSCTDGSWTPSTGNETLPITCVNWYQAYAFCIWDGGFLPTEAEWNYAAAGGSEQRKYPWGATDPGADAKLAIYGCYYKSASACSLAPVGSVPAGNGKWGHADLAGNVWEFTLDDLTTRGGARATDEGAPLANNLLFARPWG
jgi:formylglycine-generating enzyme required for sulfatase activity